MLPWIFNLIYVGLALAASPWLLYRSWTQRKYRTGWSEKLWGDLIRERPLQPSLWIHAVSVGEVLQLPPLIRGLIEAYPHHEIVVTVTTETGHQVAQQKLSGCTVRYCPLDFSWAVSRALRQVRPDMLILVELELWPNLILAAKRFQVPLVLVNGRVSKRSYQGYSRISFLMKRLLTQFELLMPQTVEYAERLIALGAPRTRVVVTGNLKFDGLNFERQQAGTVELARHFQLDSGSLVFVAGSTQPSEEAIAIDAWEMARKTAPTLQLILVPRHKERFDEVAGLIVERGYSIRRRSMAPDISTATTEPAICLLDTLGELNSCWGLADMAFVGGSLTRRGGQNMMEPAAYGAAICFGPNTWNFRDVVEALLGRQAARVVRSGPELGETLTYWINHPFEREQIGRVARQFVLEQQGATGRTLHLISKLLERQSGGRRQAA